MERTPSPPPPRAGRGRGRGGVRGGEAGGGGGGGAHSADVTPMRCCKARSATVAFVSRPADCDRIAIRIKRLRCDHATSSRVLASPRPSQQSVGVCCAATTYPRILLGTVSTPGAATRYLMDTRYTPKAVPES